MKAKTLMLMGAGGLAVYWLSQRRQTAPTVGSQHSLDDIVASLTDWQTNGWGAWGDSWDWTYEPSVADSVNARLGWNSGALGSL